jgi:hypothetical protein
MAGALALATGAVGAVALQSASPSNPDAELIALCDRYIAEWAAYNRALEREWAAEDVARAKEPPCPPELQEPLLFGDGMRDPTIRLRGDEAAFWPRDILAMRAEPDSVTRVNRIKKTDNKLFMRSLDLPVPEETRARCRYLVTVHDRWDAAIEATKADLRPLEAVSEEADDRCLSTMAEILEYEPETLAGIAALARVALESDMLATCSGHHSAIEETIFKAIVRLDGGSV